MARKHQFKRTITQTLSKWLRLQLLVLINWFLPHPRVLYFCLTITLPIESTFFTAARTVCTEVSAQGYVLRTRYPAIKCRKVKPAGEQQL